MCDQLTGYLFLGRPRELVHTFVVEQGDLVVIGADCALHKIRRQQRHLLGPALSLGVLSEFLALSCKSDAKGRPRPARDPGKYVWIGSELEVEAIAAPFDLLCTRIDYVIIADRRHADVDVRARYALLHGVEHVARRDHVDALYAERRSKAGGAGYEHDARPCFTSSASDRVTHLAGALIGDSTHGINGLESGAGGYEHPGALQKLRREEVGYGFGNRRCLYHAPHTNFAARLIAAGRPQDGDSVATQLLNVAARCGVVPHLTV